MELINFNLNIKSKEYQTVMAFSLKKNTFLILAQLDPLFENNNTAKLNQINFKVHNLNNRLNYNVIKNIGFSKRTDPNGPAFYIEIGTSESYNYDTYRTSFKSLNYNFDGKDKPLRFHLVHNRISEGPINSGDWPCNTVEIIGGKG